MKKYTVLPFLVGVYFSGIYWGDVQAQENQERKRVAPPLPQYRGGQPKPFLEQDPASVPDNEGRSAPAEAPPSTTVTPEAASTPEPTATAEPIVTPEPIAVPEPAATTPSTSRTAEDLGIVTPKKRKSGRVNTSSGEEKNAVATAAERKGPPPADSIPHGKDLVSIDFPNGVSLNDVIKTVGIWSGKNFILGQGVSGNTKISIISSEKVTKEEAYQAFLSALNVAGFTTVETGKIVKILPVANARSSNIKTYYGESWAPATDEIINQVIPLHYVDATSIINQLRPLLGQTLYTSFTTTNSLILTDTGNRIKRLLEIIKLLDEKTNQAQVTIVPINYMEAKDAVSKVTDIFGSRSGSSLVLQKAIVEERTNSVILVGSARGLDDVVRFLERIDKPVADKKGQSLIRVRTLDYADAEKIAQTLQALTQNTNASARTFGRTPPPFAQPTPIPGLPAATQPQVAADLSGTKVTADKSTNSLIIQGTKAAFDELEIIINQLDKRRAQVYVEADIVDLGASSELNWSPSALGGGTSQNATFPFGFNATSSVPFTVSRPGGSTTDLPNLGSSAFLGILTNTSISLANGYTLRPGALIFAIKTDRNTNVLQSPSMIVSDNETANFTYNTQFNIAVQVPNPNGTGIVTQLKNYDVVTSLKVKPQISRADYVNLQITLQMDDTGSVDASTGYPNPIYKRSADSIVSVHNGQTAVLGGITRDSSKLSESKVPLLGDIPIIGWLFKSVNRIKEKANLTLFLTPHVIRDANDLSKIYDEKIRDRDEFLKFYYGSKFKDEEFYSLLPKPEDGLLRPENNLSGKKEEGGDQEDGDDKKNGQKRIMLPTEDPNPINAPVSGPGGAQPSFVTQPPPPPALPSP